MSTRTRILPAGWYPTSASKCVSEIKSFIQDSVPPEGPWMGGVAPHAGWFFSGRAAARVFHAISRSMKPDRVVVYGGHLPGHSDPMVYTEDAWETPLDLQPMDSNLAMDLISRGEALAAGPSFHDNTVEVLLPMVRHFFPDAKLVAVHAPSSAKAIRLGEAVHRLLAEKALNAVYIGSADLTHYGPNYGFSPKGTGPEAVQWVKNDNDRRLIDRAVAMDAPGLLEDARALHNTCSAGPIASVMASAARHGVTTGTLLEYYTSFDVMPNKSFVGYAALLF